MQARYSRSVRKGLAIAALVLAACTHEESIVAQAAGVASLPAEAIERVAPPVAPTLAPFARCVEGELAAERTKFGHVRSRMIAKAAPANHFAHDVAANPGKPIAVSAKFSYGKQGKDLEDESVSVWLDDCTGVTQVGSGETDGDGRATVEITAPDRAGEYALHCVVGGAASRARARLGVVPRGTPVVVFDIDGTLTQSDAEVNKDVLDEHFDAMYAGDYAPLVYEDGAVLAGTWVEKGVLPIYISGRPYWLVDYSRNWLARESFPRGFVRTTDKHREVVPKVDGVGRFKSSTLKQLLDLGVEVQAAYGNATTDIWAYSTVGIPLDRTFIIGPHAGKDGTRAVKDAWTPVLPWALEHAVPKGALQLR